MGKSAWHEWEPPDDGQWVEMRPGEPGYDAAYAADLVPLHDRPTVRQSPDFPVLLYMGCQIGWSVEREGRRAGVEVIDPETGGSEVVAACTECGNDAAGDHGVHLKPGVLCLGCLAFGGR